MNGPVEIYDAFARLTLFLEGCSVPGVRALAISRFVERAARPLVGTDDLIRSPRERMCEVVSDPQCRLLFPEQVAAVVRACEALDLQAPSAESLTGYPPPPSDRVEDGCIRVVLPTVLEIPPLFPGEVPLAVPLLMTLCVFPEPWSGESNEIRWVGQSRRSLYVGQPTLQPVALEALQAARASAASRNGSPGVSSADRPRLTRLVFGCNADGSGHPFVGGSAGLAFGVAFLSANDAKRSAGRGRFPRPDWAWTGCPLPSGEIGPVHAETLAVKVRAAHAAGLRGITVPATQLEMARAAVPPNADAFTVIGASTLREALAHDASTSPGRLPSRALRHPIGHRFRAVWRAVAALALIGVVAYWVLSQRGPSVAIDEDLLTVRVSFAGGARPRSHSDPFGRRFAYADIGTHLPGDERGGERLVLLTRSGGRAASLEVRDPRSFRLIWEHTFESSGHSNDPRKSKREIQYNGKAAVIADLDGDGDQEIVVATSAHPYSPSFLTLFDDDPVPAGVIFHSGHIQDVKAVDCDGDGILDLAASGVHQPSRGASMLVLTSEQLRRAANQTATRDAADADSAALAAADPTALQQACLAHLVMPLVPGLAAELGVREMHVSTEAFEPATAPGERPVLRLAVGVDMGDPMNEVYFASFLPPDSLLDVTPNAPLVRAAARWIAEGRTRVDFASQGTIDEWARTFRVYRHVCLDWDSASIGFGQELNRGRRADAVGLESSE